MEYCSTDFPSPTFQRNFFLLVMFGTCYFLPLMFICVCYSRVGLRIWAQRKSTECKQSFRQSRKRNERVVKMLITVTAVFALFWLPLYVIQFFIYFAPSFVQRHERLVVNYLKPISQLLGSATSAVNPLIYCYFSVQFRQYIHHLLRCKARRSTSSTSNGSPSEKTKATEFLLEPKA